MSEFDYQVGNPAPEGAVLVASYDVADAYEVDDGEVYKLSDGRFYYRWASGCSCWEGEYYSDVYADFRTFVVFGIDRTRLEALEYEPDFANLKDEGLSLRDVAEAQ